MTDKQKDTTSGKIATTKVVTRFAPSPTGALHIGGARTALFNWLYAKHTGGTFLLRIEDTDRERSKQEHVAAILASLTWLGLDWDGDPLFQFARADRHRAVADELLAKGGAYRCYLTPDELAAMRAKAEAEKTPFTVQSPWRDRDPADAPKGIKPAIRLRAERNGETVTDDQVQGRVAVPNKDLDDLIILRSDGAPTYNFAVVVDDHDMAVTHVIRGVDHMTNTARQTQVYKAIGWDLPNFAHIPLVHGSDGAKLSKRHGAQGVEDYRDMGYLPAALRNYLVRLGWSHGDDEIFSTDQAIAWFDVKDVGRSAARFDFAKLSDLNGHYIRGASDAELLDGIKSTLPHLDFAAATAAHDPKAPPRADVELGKKVAAFMPNVKTGKQLAALFEKAGWDKVHATIPSIRERAKTLPELVEGALFLITNRPLQLDEKAIKLLDADARRMLRGLARSLDASSAWDAASLENIVRVYAETAGKKLGQVAQPLRAALTGRSVSPPVFDVMVVLGKAEALARIKDQEA